jgi:hypothetical protein
VPNTSQPAPHLHVAPPEHSRPGKGAVPKLSGDIRHLIPKLGLRNYWYPAIGDRAVGSRKPVKVSLLGEEICLFRGANGDVAAIQDGLSMAMLVSWHLGSPLER